MAALLLFSALFSSASSADCNCSITIHPDGVWNCLPTTCSDAAVIDLYTVNATVLDLGNVVRVWGDFRILASRHITDIIAPKLTSVFGKFSIEQNVELVSVEFPLLRDATGYFKIQKNTVLVSARFPVLTESPYLEITGNPVLEKVAFNDLAMVPNIVITNNALLTSVLLPALHTVENIDIDASDLIDVNNLQNASDASFANAAELHAGALATAGSISCLAGVGAKSIAFPVLASADSLEISASPTAEVEFSFPKLKTWTESASFGGGIKSISLPALTTSVSLSIEDTNLVSVELPALTTAKEAVSISKNAKLKSVSLPKLTRASELEFWTNPELTALRFPELTQVQSLSVKGYNYLTEFSVPKLQNAGFIGFGLSSLFEQNNEDKDQVVKTLKPRGEDVILSFPALINATTLTFKNDQSFTVVSVPLLTRLPNLNFQLTTVAKISLPALTNAATQVNFYRNSQLNSLELPVLKSVGRFALSFSDELTGLNFQSLTTAKYVNINDNYGLTQISFPVLTSSSIDISSNIMLKTVDLPKLKTSPSVHVADLRVYEGVAGCVNLDCLSFDKADKPAFSVYWCRKQNSTIPDCSKGMHWDCTCSK